MSALSHINAFWGQLCVTECVENVCGDTYVSGDSEELKSGELEGNRLVMDMIVKTLETWGSSGLEKR